jgi:glycosyltransferase involved in cell wall biosynthesis
MTETDRLSILICVHSVDDLHDGLLLKSVESLSRQTYSDFETVIILDDCWDKTKKVLFNFLDSSDLKDVKILEKENKRGHAAAKNFGLKHCSGDWVAFLDADDQYMDCKIEEQRNFLLRNRDVDFCATASWDVVDGKVKVNCFSIDQYRDHEEIKRRISVENVICGASVMTKKEYIEDIGGYPEGEKYFGWEDWKLWINAIGSGYKFYKIPERLYLCSLGTSVPR